MPNSKSAAGSGTGAPKADASPTIDAVNEPIVRPKLHSAHGTSDTAGVTLVRLKLSERGRFSAVMTSEVNAGGRHPAEGLTAARQRRRLAGWLLPATKTSGHVSARHGDRRPSRMWPARCPDGRIGYADAGQANVG